METVGKIRVKVRLDADTEGKNTPLLIKWPDGTVYKIRRVVDCRAGASLKAGIAGTRYLCNIGTVYAHLYNEQPFWYMEEKDGRPVWFER